MSLYDSPEFQALRREYAAGAKERSARLHMAAAALRQGEAVELTQLRQEIHKLRGSGGFYGFARLSAAAGKAEDQILLILDGEAERNDQALSTLVADVAAEAEAAAQEAGI